MLAPSHSQQNQKPAEGFKITRPVIRVPSSYSMSEADITDSLSTSLNFGNATISRPIVKHDFNNNAPYMKPINFKFESQTFKRPSFKPANPIPRDFRPTEDVFDPVKGVKVEIVTESGTPVILPAGSSTSVPVPVPVPVPAPASVPVKAPVSVAPTKPSPTTVKFLKKQMKQKDYVKIIKRNIKALNDIKLNPADEKAHMDFFINVTDRWFSGTTPKDSQNMWVPATARNYSQPELQTALISMQKEFLDRKMGFPYDASNIRPTITNGMGITEALNMILYGESVDFPMRTTAGSKLSMYDIESELAKKVFAIDTTSTPFTWIVR